MPSAVSRRYKLFGLRVASEVELPEALRDEPTGDFDINVRLGPIDVPARPPGISVIGGALLLTVPDVGRYWVRNGRDILIDVLPGVPDKNVRLYLLGSAMGAALHQRGLLPLHANAVEIDASAVAFVGTSGAGKSTLAGWFHDRGHRVLSDDVCVVHGDEAGEPIIFPAVRRLRLSRDALLASGRAVGDYDASYSGDPDFDKFDVPLPRDHGTPVRLSAVVLLEFGPDHALVPLRGMEGARTLFDHTYRGAMVSEIGNIRLHWQAVIGLIPKIILLRWTRPRDHAVLTCGGEALLSALRGSIGHSPDQTLRSQTS